MPLNYEAFFEATFALQRSEVAVVLTNPESISIGRHAMAARWRDGLATLAERIGSHVLPLMICDDTSANGAPLPELCRVGDEEHWTEDILAKATLVLALTAHSATGPLLDATRRYPRLRAASLPGVVPEMEQTALLANPADLIERNRILRGLLDSAVLARIEFSTGDQLDIDLRQNIAPGGIAGSNNARSDDGYLPPDAQQRLINLPSGETWRCPYEEVDPVAANADAPERQSRTEGVLPTKDDRGAARLIVQRGRVVSIEGTGAAADDHRQLFAVDPARGNIAEFGLGSNPQAIVRGSILEDEKAGPHIAYGRSDYLGGLISVAHFARPENVLHIDIVYAKQSPIYIKRLALIADSGAERLMMTNGDYVIF